MFRRPQSTTLSQRLLAAFGDRDRTDRLAYARCFRIVFPPLFLLLLVLLLAGLSSCLAPVKAVIKQHKEEATQWDGPRCPMYPSCASWGEHAIEEHGWLGFLLTVDRLFVREAGGMQNHYTVTPRKLSKTPRYYDPLEDSFGKSEPTLFSIDVSENP